MFKEIYTFIITAYKENQEVKYGKIKHDLDNWVE